MTPTASAPFQQPKITLDLLAVVRRYRIDRSISMERLTLWMTDHGFPINYHQYLAIEDGRTKCVPADVIVLAALYLEIPGHELFPQLDF